MSELILKGTDLFMKKTGSADKIHISGNTERMLFLILGILLVFAGAKVYRLIVSFITVHNTIVTPQNIMKETIRRYTLAPAKTSRIPRIRNSILSVFPLI